MADSDTGSGHVGDSDAPGVLAWEPLRQVRIVGHDGLHAKLVCLLCPATQPTYGVRGSLAGVVTWATQHYLFLHETQVAARDD